MSTRSRPDNPGCYKSEQVTATIVYSSPTGDAVTTLVARAANAGMFERFLKVYPGEAASYPFGREPDGAPSHTWKWQELASQNRGSRKRQPDA